MVSFLSCYDFLLFSIIVLVFIPHPQLHAGRVFQIGNDLHPDNVRNGVPTFMTTCEPVTAVAKQSTNKPGTMIVVDEQVRSTHAYMAALPAAKIQQPQKLSARQVQVLILRDNKGSRPAVLLKLSCSW